MNDPTNDQPTDLQSGVANAALKGEIAIVQTPDAAESQRFHDERLGTVLSDRVCVKCFFNLAGQPIVRERIYGLVAARCPECGTIAAIQEYPHLGRWPRRFVMLLAMGWLVLMLLGLIGSSAIVQSAAPGLAQVIADPGAVKLAEAHLEYQKEKAALAGPPSPNAAQASWILNQAPSSWSSIEEAYLKDHPPDGFFMEAGGWATVWRWPVWISWTMSAMGVLVVGMCWAVALPHAKRWRRMLMIVPIVGIAAVMVLYHNQIGFGGGPFASWNWSNGWQYASWAVQRKIYLPIAIVTTASMTVPLLIGVFIGRGVARLAIRMLIPPRLREPLFFLWFCDGYTPPKVR